MYAAYTTVEVLTDKIDEMVRVYEAQITPQIRQMQGFRSVQLWADRATGRLIGVSLWETAADADAAGSSPAMAQTQAKLSAFATGAFTRNVYEVLLSS